MKSPEKRPRGKPLAQVLHEESCAVAKWGKPWEELMEETKRNYEQIAKAIEREVMKRHVCKT